MEISKNMKTLFEGLMLLDLTETDLLAISYMLDSEVKIIKMLKWFKIIKFKPNKKQVLNKARDIALED